MLLLRRNNNPSPEYPDLDHLWKGLFVAINVLTEKSGARSQNDWPTKRAQYKSGKNGPRVDPVGK